MREVEPFFIRHGSYAPFLHSQGAEQNLNEVAFFILADFIYHESIG